MPKPAVCSSFTSSFSCNDLYTIAFAEEHLLDCKEIVNHINTRIRDHDIRNSYAKCVTSFTPGDTETNMMVPTISIQIVNPDKEADGVGKAAGDDSVSIQPRYFRSTNPIIIFCAPNCLPFLLLIHFFHLFINSRVKLHARGQFTFLTATKALQFHRVHKLYPPSFPPTPYG